MLRESLSKKIRPVAKSLREGSPRRIVVACFCTVFALTAVLAARQYWLIYQRELDSRQFNLHLQAIAVDSAVDTAKAKLHFLRIAAERILFSAKSQLSDKTAVAAVESVMSKEQEGVWRTNDNFKQAPIFAISDARLKEISGLSRNADQLNEDLLLAQFMSQILPVEYLQGQNIANVLYISTSGIVVAYPTIRDDQLEPLLRTFAASNLLKFSALTPFENSYTFTSRQGNPIAAGQRLQFGTPIALEKNVRGVIIFDVPQELLQEYMQKTSPSGEIHVLLNRQGRLIATNQSVAFSDTESWLKKTLEGSSAPTIENLFNNQTGIFLVGEEHLIYRKLDRADLMLLEIIPDVNFRWAVISQFSTLFLCIWISLGFLMLMTLFIVDRLLKKQMSLNEKLSKLSLVDTLTQLANRRRLTNDFNALANRSRGKDPISLMMVDIDKFKLVNDNWGHSAGDEVLKHLALKCRTSVRSQDLVARYGGEEFCVLLPGATLEEAGVIAEKMRAAIGQSVCIPDVRTLSSTAPSQQIRITVSIGVAEYIRDGCDRLDDLVAKADGRLYLAKQHGRNRVICDDNLQAHPIAD